MKRSKRMIVFILGLVMSVLTACSGNVLNSDIESDNVFAIEDYNMSFTFPGNWEKETETVFDLQCTDKTAYASIFVYNKIDLAEGQTPLTMYKIQNDDLFSKRQNVKIITDETENELGNKRIHSTMYSAENDGMKNYYYCNLIEFEEESEVFAWVLFSAIPSEVEDNIDVWNTIVASAEYNIN